MRIGISILPSPARYHSRLGDTGGGVLGYTWPFRQSGLVLESAEIILQVNQINPLGNGKYGLIIHDCENEMKALLNSSMSGLVRGESLIDGTTRTWRAPAVLDAG